MFLDQLIEKTAVRAIRKRLLLEKDALTYVQAVEIACQVDAAKHEALQLGETASAGRLLPPLKCKQLISNEFTGSPNPHQDPREQALRRQNKQRDRRIFVITVVCRVIKQAISHAQREVKTVIVVTS